MARPAAEIQADIARTRRVIERQLDQLARRVSWARPTPYLALAGALGLGLLLSRIPLLRLVGFGARAVQTGVTVAGTVAAVDRFLATRAREAA